MNYTEFAQKIKTKYPEYQEMDDLELSQKVVSKYPEYKDTVDFNETAEQPTETTKPIPADIGLSQSFAKGLTFGTAPLIAGGVDVLRNIGKNVSSGNLNYLKDTGKSFEQGRKRFLESQGQYEKEAPVAATLADIAGGLAMPVGSAGAVAKGLSTLQKIKQGAKVGSALGGAYGLGTGLSENQDKAVDIQKGLKGAGIGAGIGALGGTLATSIPLGIKKLITSKDVGRKLDYIVPSGTQKKTIENIIENPKVQKEAVKKGFNMNYDIYLDDASKRIVEINDEIKKIANEAYKDIPDNIKIDLTKNNALGKMRGAIQEFEMATQFLPNEQAMKESTTIVNNLSKNLIEDKYIKTPKFKKWFDGSKIIDEKGEPLLVYHGGDKFDNFDINKTNYNGFWFTNSKSEAQSYIKKNGEMKSVYLDMKNPATVDTVDKYGFNSKVGKAFRGLKLKELQNMGYDGVILPGEKTNSYVVFKPDQIRKIEEPMIKIDFGDLKKLTNVLNELSQKNRTAGDYTTANMYNKMRKALVEARDEVPQIKKASSLYEDMMNAKSKLENALGVDLANPKNVSTKILTDLRDNKGNLVNSQIEDVVGIFSKHPETKHLTDINDKIKLAQTSYDLRPKEESKLLSAIASKGKSLIQELTGTSPAEKARNLAQRLASGKLTKEQLGESFNLVGSPLFEESINKLVQGQKAYGGKISSVGKGIGKMKLGTYALPRITIKELLKEKE